MNNKSSKVFISGIALVSLLLFQSAFAGAQKVIVNNGASDPVPVKVLTGVATTAADNPAFQPYGKDQSGAGPSDDYIASIPFDVPAGKRFVIQSVTFFSDMPSGQNLWAATLRTTINGNNVYQNLSVEAQGQDANGNARFTGTHDLHSYCDAGTGTVSIGFSRSANTGSWSIGASVVGYLVDLAANPD